MKFLYTTYVIEIISP